MRISIGNIAFSFSEEAAKKIKREAFIKDRLKAYSFLPIKKEILSEKFGEVWDSLNKPEKKSK